MQGFNFIDLPGVRNRVAEIESDLRAGKSVVIVFPDHAVESGTAEILLAEIKGRSTNSEWCASGSAEFPKRLLESFEADDSELADYAGWDRFTRWPKWGGEWLVFLSWEHEDTGKVVERWPAQLKASGLATDVRPRLILAATLDAVPVNVLRRVDQNEVAVHWWWGSVDRLDTELCVAVDENGRTRDALDRAVISEVACWDLESIGYLAANWDGRVSTIDIAIEGLRAERGWEGEVLESNAPAGKGHRRPATGQLEYWQTGKVERWGGGNRVSPMDATASELRRRLWLAHSKILMPVVDDHRAEVERRMSELVPDHVTDRARREGNGIVEIGNLRYLFDTGVLRLPRDDGDALVKMTKLRNLLAHREPASDDLVVAVREKRTL
ncbi:hypothetical protein [Dietzia maris]|uniref:hypothetical protein n=1 Tax=Dietzia maris TaxID=37915 RepID=UPI0037C8D137